MYEKELRLAKKAALEAGKIIKSHYHKKHRVKAKGRIDIATEADLLSEKKIVKILIKEFPEHEYITEEEGNIGNESDYTWYIDPLDGTVNFFEGIDLFCVSIALAYKNEVVVGVIYNPLTHELLYAVKGKGAYLNRRKLRVNRQKNFNKCIMGANASLVIGKLAAKFKDHTLFRGKRVMGSAAMETVFVAKGIYDLYINTHPYPWDVAAGAIIVREAGGEVSTFKGKKWTVKDRTFVASSKVIHQKILNIVKKTIG